MLDDKILRFRIEGNISNYISVRVLLVIMVCGYGRLSVGMFGVEVE